MSGSVIAKVIKKNILRLDLDLSSLVGQGYELVKGVTKFFQSAKRNDHFISIVKSESPPKTKSYNVTLCTTRFVDRYVARLGLLQQYGTSCRTLSMHWSQCKVGL